MSTTILSIESSCDETAAAIVVDGREVKSNIIYSQIELHKLYGGVVPEIASRKHVEKVNQVIRAAIEEAHVTWDDIDAVAVTYGPGLVGALLVGVSAAKAVAYAKKKPLVGVHHIEGHIAANYIEHPDLEPPFMCMVASGGHSHLVYVKDYTTFEIVGRTRDDAAGEAFDKVARAIGLGYPGGPKIDKLAKEGNKEAIHFPRAFMEDAPYDFSFSGLKSAVLNYLNGCEMKHQEINRADVAASFQQAVVDVLTDNSVRAAKAYGCKKLALAGGVASNSSLRENMQRVASEQGLQFYYPSPIFCTDNAAMIGVAGYHNYGGHPGWTGSECNTELKDWGTQIMVTAIVLAAGVGSRMKSEKAKQFLEVAGHEVLYYSLRAFDEHPEVDSIVLVTKEEFVEHCQKELAERYQFAKVRDICIGGKERYDSVYQGLSAIGAEGENGIVLIHDGARPFDSRNDISFNCVCKRMRSLYGRRSCKGYDQDCGYRSLWGRDAGTKICIPDSDTADISGTIASSGL